MLHALILLVSHCLCLRTCRRKVKSQSHRSKDRTYPDLLNNQRCRLVLLAIEVGGQMERGGRSLHQQPGTSQSQTGTNHPPTKRCGRSHRTLVRHIDPCSRDPNSQPPFSAKFTPNLYNVDTDPRNWSQPWRKPRRTLFLQSTSPTFRSIPGPPGPWTFALRARRASRVPGDRSVEQSEPQTDAGNRCGKKKTNCTLQFES